MGLRGFVGRVYGRMIVVEIGGYLLEQAGMGRPRKMSSTG